MGIRKIIGNILFASLLLVGLLSCFQKVESKPNFIFKGGAVNKGIVAKVAGENITRAEFMKGIAGELYQKENELYEMKMNRLRAILLERLMMKDPKKKGKTNDQFLDQIIAKGIVISDAETTAFIKERNIPKEQVNDQIKLRIKDYLTREKKKVAIEKWIGEKTKNSPVEVYFSKPERPTFKIEIGDSPYVGGKNAKVTIVEFSDFQCPFCKKGAEITKGLKKKYGDKIKIVFKNFPLPFHNHAKDAANASLCANEQGVDKFWKLHDLMFADQTKLSQDGLEVSAKKIGLDIPKYKGCMDAKKYAQKITNDIKEGQKVGVKSTPTFFINGKLINGAHPLEVFSELIDQDLAK